MAQPRLLDQRVRYGLLLDALPPPPARILEVGVGQGWLTREMDRRGYEVFGCDVTLDGWTHEDMQRFRVSFASEDGSLVHDTDFFDAVVSCDVLEHVSPAHRKTFILELVRVTRPGGEILLTAFFRITRAFGLWGGIIIGSAKSLPRWYVEHLEIPLPSERETEETLSQGCHGVTIFRYQRSLNILTCAAQGLSGRFGLAISKLADLISHVVPTIDIFGETTSTMFRATKRN